jgi:hypothetical protein
LRSVGEIVSKFFLKSLKIGSNHWVIFFLGKWSEEFVMRVSRVEDNAEGNSSNSEISNSSLGSANIFVINVVFNSLLESSDPGWEPGSELTLELLLSLSISLELGSEVLGEEVLSSIDN